MIAITTNNSISVNARRLECMVKDSRGRWPHQGWRKDAEMSHDRGPDPDEERFRQLDARQLDASSGQLQAESRKKYGYCTYQWCAERSRCHG